MTQSISAAAFKAMAQKPEKKRNKFGAIKSEVDGFTFDSKAEARRYSELRIREKAGEICELELQPRFVLQAGDKGEVVGVYLGDFAYHDLRQKRRIVEDVKGQDTKLSAWKRRHVRAQFGINVEIIK